MNTLDEYLNYLQEAGFKNYPKGWTRDSVRKFGLTLAKGVEGGPKSPGFFKLCVKKMKGKLDDPEAFCASVKDEVHASTYWRGKGKSPAKVQKSIKTHPKIPKKPKGK
jgi:hypothetical protein